MTADSHTATAVATMQLANKESDEHMIGMEAVYEEFRHRPMIIRAHCSDSCADTALPSVSTTGTAAEPWH